MIRWALRLYKHIARLTGIAILIFYPLSLIDQIKWNVKIIGVVAIVMLICYFIMEAFLDDPAGNTTEHPFIYGVYLFYSLVDAITQIVIFCFIGYGIHLFLGIPVLFQTLFVFIISVNWWIIIGICLYPVCVIRNFKRMNEDYSLYMGYD